MSAQRIGVLGGTFDPPHLGHLIVARDAADELALDRVLLMLSARPPHRTDADLTSADLRYSMLKAAAGSDPLLEASDLELRRPGPSYTVETLAELRRRHPGADLVLLIGVDQWRQFESWRDPERIGELATVAVMARAGEVPRDRAATDTAFAVPWLRCPVTRLDISSTEIRERVRQGRSVRHLVPNPVLGIIERNALYAATDAPLNAVRGARQAS